MIAVSILMAANSSQSVVEVMYRILSKFAVSPGAEHGHEVRVDDFDRFAFLGIWAAAGIAHHQQSQRDDRQQGNCRLKPFFSRELRTLDSAARLHSRGVGGMPPNDTRVDVLTRFM